MATESEIRTRIAEIDALLASGVSSVSYKDRAQSFNLDALSKERSRLMRSISGSSSYRRVTFKNG